MLKGKLSEGVRLLALAGILALGVLAPNGIAHAHPHDALAQCQVWKDGKLVWVMCDDTVHDSVTNKHKPKSKSAVPFRGFKAKSFQPLQERFRQ